MSTPVPVLAPPDRVTKLPDLGPIDGVQFAGCAPCMKNESIFYWFAGTSDYADRPTILWTNGGPGSSSFWGFFLENGPYEVESAVGGPIVRPREHAWNRHANFMIVEHPLSVTLSFANDPADIP